MPPTPILSVDRCDHVGISVPSLDRALDFWTGLLGATIVTRFTADGDVVHAITGAPLDSAVTGALISIAGQRIELLEYSNLGETPAVPPPFAPGTLHLALNVADVGLALTQLAVHDFLPVGDLANSPNRSVYVRGPGGVSLEIRQSAV